MIVNLRGSSGAGKSYVTRELLKKYPPEAKRQVAGLFSKKKARVVANELPGNLTVLGNYEYYQMGGLDGYKPWPSVKELITRYANARKFLVYEGLLLGQQRGLHVELGRQLGPENVILAVLDTPFEECLRRIYARNGGAVIKESTVETAWNHVRRQSESMAAAGECQLVYLDHRDPFPQLERLLLDAGWDPTGAVADTDDVSLDAMETVFGSPYRAEVVAA